MEQTNVILSLKIFNNLKSLIMERNLTTEKTCERCGQRKSIDNFALSTSSRNPDGHVRYCKQCIAKARSVGQRRRHGEVIPTNGDVNGPLSDFTIRELCTELKRRGVKWERMFLIRTDEIMFEKI